MALCARVILGTVVYSKASFGQTAQIWLFSTYLLGLCLESRGKHFREELQEDRKQELHEGDDDEHHERDKAEQVCTRPHQLHREGETELGISC